MAYRALAPQIKIKVAEHAHTASDIETLLATDPSSDDQWEFTLARAALRDRIDQFADGPERMTILNVLIGCITDAQSNPSTHRDALLAHLLKKVSDTLASKETFSEGRWYLQYTARDAALFTARTDFESVHRLLMPLVTEKAQVWFREAGLCTQLRFETMPSVVRIRTQRIWSILQGLESDVSSVRWKAALITDLLEVVVGDEWSNDETDKQRTIKTIFLHVLSLLPAYPVKYRVKIMETVTSRQQMMPVRTRDVVLEKLLPIAQSIPPDYQAENVPPSGLPPPRLAETSAVLSVIGFADYVSRHKWITSLDNLINLVSLNKRDRPAALGILAVRCIQHAAHAIHDGENPVLHDATYLNAFRKIIMAIDTIAPPHRRFDALLPLQLHAMPTHKYAELKQIGAIRAAHATILGSPNEALNIFMQLFDIVQRR